MRYHFLLLLGSISIVLGQGNPPCVFCEIVRGEREVSTVYRDSKVMVFMDHAPVNPGHALIIPIAHGENLLELPDDTAREMMSAAQKVGAAYQRTDLKSEAFQLHMNNGRFVQNVRHAHLHVWPRFRGDFPGDAPVRLASQRARVERPELEAVAAKLRKAIELGDLYAAFYEEGLALDPLSATYIGDPRFNDRLPNYLSDEFKKSKRDYTRKYLAKLKTFARSSLPAKEQVNYDVLEWELESSLALLEFPTELLPLDQFSSLHITFGMLASGKSPQPFKTVTDYENWLKRLNGVTQWCFDAVDRMREGMTNGYLLPKALALKTLPQLAKLTAGPAEKHPFFAPIETLPAEFAAQDRERLTTAYSEIIRAKIIPAFAMLHTFVSTEYLPRCRETAGISDIPRGREYYERLIRLHTTTDMTADEIFELGQREVKRILGEMEKVKQQVGFGGTLHEFFEHLRTRKELIPYTDPQQVIDSFNAIHKKMQPQLDRLFDISPATQFEVRRTEAFREATAAAQYMPGSLDGTRPGVFYVPIPNVREYNIVHDEALFLHEAIPGHHYQVSLQQEDKSGPQFRRILMYGAYTEGWGLYCESLGRELGLYQDPYQYLGMLSMEMHRAIRLVVDTGIHAKGWTREQAIAYSLENEARSEPAVIAEIERYMAIPGQALSYKIGQLRIRALREHAEKELGKDFDIRDFHTQVLSIGNVPLKILEKRINDWIEQKNSE